MLAKDMYLGPGLYDLGQLLFLAFTLRPSSSTGSCCYPEYLQKHKLLKTQDDPTLVCDFLEEPIKFFLVEQQNNFVGLPDELLKVREFCFIFLLS